MNKMYDDLCYKISHLEIGTYIVVIKLKYNYEDDYRIEQTVVSVGIDEYITWLDDWWEGEEYVELVSYHNIIYFSEMTNLQKYIETFIDDITHNFGVNKETNIPVLCENTPCSDCLLNGTLCKTTMKEWLQKKAD